MCSIDSDGLICYRAFYFTCQYVIIQKTIVNEDSRMQAEQDYYKILGISPSANTKEINEAYRKRPLKTIRIEIK